MTVVDVFRAPKGAELAAASTAVVTQVGGEGGRAWEIQGGRVKPFWLVGTAGDDLSVVAAHLGGVAVREVIGERTHSD